MIELDWENISKRREMIIEHYDEVPPYLIYPEVKKLLHNIKDARFQFLVNTLWNTGCRISEALSLTPESFRFEEDFSYVSINTLKKRPGPAVKKAKRGKPKGTGSKRIVPIYDPSFRLIFQSHCQAFKIRPNDLIFTRQRFAYNKRFITEIAKLDEQGISFPIVISPKTMRHSFAVNCLLHEIPLIEISEMLGHADIKETRVYTKIVAGETHSRMGQVRF